jgi:hypothetical protein
MLLDLHVVINSIIEASQQGDHEKYILYMNELYYPHMTWTDIENIFSHALLGGNINIITDLLNIILWYSGNKGISEHFAHILEKLASYRSVKQIEPYITIFKDHDYYRDKFFIGAIRGNNFYLLVWLLLNYPYPNNILKYAYISNNDDIIKTIHNYMTYDNGELIHAMTGACISQNFERMNSLYHDYQVRGSLLNQPLMTIIEMSYQPYEKIIIWLVDHGATVNPSVILGWYKKMLLIKPMQYDLNSTSNRIHNKIIAKRNRKHNNMSTPTIDHIVNNLANLHLYYDNNSPDDIVRKLTGIKI